MLRLGTSVARRMLQRQRIVQRTLACRVYSNTNANRKLLLDTNFNAGGQIFEAGTLIRANSTFRDVGRLNLQPCCRFKSTSGDLKAKIETAAAGKSSSSAGGPEEKTPSVGKNVPGDINQILNSQPVEDKTSTTQAKHYEIQTSKGILSISTTIEDSKINDVVFEKSPKKQLESLVKKQEAQLKKDEPPPLSTDVKPASVILVNASQEQRKTENVQTIQKAIQDAVLKPIDQSKKKRTKVDYNRSSLERNFITPARAMSDFLLKPSDLENMSKIKRRSPYEMEPPITVHWRKEVEAKAIEVWGSRENLLRELLKREVERKKHQQNIFTVKRRLREYRREIGARAVLVEDEPGLRGKSGKVVLLAVGINAMNFVFKTCCWAYTGSHTMFAESIHSLADVINQLILAYGIHKSTQLADRDHPYGYANMKYVSSLISGVGIFCVGAGLSFYHGILGLTHPEPSVDFFWAFFVLGGSLVSEGATLLAAINKLNNSAKKENVSLKDYVISGRDPCVNVILTEDAGAVTSVALAAICMGLTSLTGSPIFDACGSLLVGGVLASVASFIIYTNVGALMGKSIPEDLLNKINMELESDVMIRAIHDVKGIDMGNSLVRYKAELDFDGRELTRLYLDKLDINELLNLVRSFQTPEELEAFLLSHGENIVDLMGGEIDRIEMKLRKKFPELRHCDLEVL